MRHLFLAVLFMSLANITFGQLEYYYPKSKCNSIITHSYFTLDYSEEFEQPEWVIYRIIGDNIKSGISKRRNNFRPDPDVKTGSSESSDYLNSGYDRGHLLPAGDMKFSDLAMSETFYYSNITPQHPSFNRGIWLRLEELVRQWTLKYDSMYVVTSGVLVDIHETIGRNKVGVPKNFYKILLHPTSKTQYESICFLIPNKAGEKDLFDYTITIDSLEKITGIDFFYKLDEEVQNKFESVVNIDYWKTEYSGL